MPTNFQNLKDKDSEEHLDIKSSAAQLREMLQQVKIFQNCNAKSERKKVLSFAFWNFSNFVNPNSCNLSNASRAIGVGGGAFSARPF